MCYSKDYIKMKNLTFLLAGRYHTTIKNICIFLSNACTCTSIFCGTPFLSYVDISLLFMRMVFCNYSYDVINFWYASSISFCRTILQFQADFTNICIIDFAFYLRMKREYLFVCLIWVFGYIWEFFSYMERLLLSVKGYKFWP